MSAPTSTLSGHPAPPAAAALLVRALRNLVAGDGLDRDVRVGECLGLLGPNGAGKTTTIEICEGLLALDEGEVVVCGRRWDTDARELLGIRLQETSLAERLTVGRRASSAASTGRAARWMT